MRISSPGTVNHGAAVVFSDGSVQTYSLVAYGRAPITLAILLGSEGWYGEIDKVPLRIYSVGTTGHEKLSPPILV